MSRESVGEFEHLVLLSILRLGPNAYGITILEEIRAQTGRAVLRPAVYVALRRLEKKGLVRSRMEDADDLRGGRARKYFRVEAEGMELIREARSALVRMWDGLEERIDGV